MRKLVNIRVSSLLALYCVTTGGGRLCSEPGDHVALAQTAQDHCTSPGFSSVTPASAFVASTDCRGHANRPFGEATLPAAGKHKKSSPPVKCAPTFCSVPAWRFPACGIAAVLSGEPIAVANHSLICLRSIVLLR